MGNEKVLAYTQLSEQASKQITSSYQEWTAFLAMTGKLYKYPFPEQLMIFAQRPDATACADYDLWNKRMRRYIRRGSKGIALIDNSSGMARLRYVFDVSDTGAKENSRSPHFWEYRPELEDTVTAALENRFGVSGKTGLAAQLGKIAGQLAEDYWNDNQRDILHTVDGSFLEEYDEFNIGVQFRSAATVSIAYTLYSRCGLGPEDYFEHEDFLAIFDFNTPQALSALGMAVSQSNEQVLRQLEVTIKRYERDKLTERSAEHGEQPDLHEDRGLPAPGPDTGGTAHEGAWQVRTNAPDIPEGTPPRIVEFPGSGRETDGALPGSRGCGGEPDGAANAAAGESGRSDGAAESGGHDGLGGADEQLPGTGGGDHPVGAGVQLTDTVPEPPQPDGRFSQEDASGQLTFNFIPSEQEQIVRIEEAERVQAPSAFPFTQKEIDDILRLGSNTSHAREHIADIFQKQKTMAEIAEYLRKQFHGGYGFKGEKGDYSTWYTADGIHIARGHRARYLTDGLILSWTDAAERIREMLENGSFATAVELAEADGPERSELALSLLYLYHDLGESAREQGYLQCLSRLPVGYPDATAQLAQDLKDPTFAETLREEYAMFFAAYMGDRSLLRFHYHRHKELWHRLKDLSLPRRGYPEGLADIPEATGFITEDEIDHALSSDHSIEGGKGRIYAYFTKPHSLKGKAAFLRNEYGTGTRFNALSDSDGSQEDPDHRGIRFQKKGCANVELSWNRVAERIIELIEKNRYLMPEELARYETSHQQAPDTATEQKAPADIREPETKATPALETETPTDTSEPETAAVTIPEPENATLQPIPSPARREITQADIEAALLEWNGNTASKRRVQQHMETHARDKDTADWLKGEYGDSLPAFPVTVDGAASDLPWTKVQRHLARLVKENRFFTPKELDSIADIDTTAVRQEPGQGEVNSPYMEQAMTDAGQPDGENALGHRFSIATIADGNSYAEPGGGFALWDEATGDYYINEESVIPTFLTRQRAEAYLAVLVREDAIGPSPTETEMYGYYMPVVENLVKSDVAYQHACKNSDQENAMLEGNKAIERAIPYISDLEFMRMYYDRTTFYEVLHWEILDRTYPLMSQQDTSQIPDLSGQTITHEDDTATILDGTAIHQTGITVTDGEQEQLKEAIQDASSARDPLAPAYQVGDTVYLDNTAFHITEIGMFDVQMRDPSLAYPVFRAESRERFEQLLQLDSRNGHITEYLPANLGHVNNVFREVLSSHLLTERDKAYISGWLRSGDGNTKVAQRLSEQFSGRSEAVGLEIGDTANYFTSTVGMDMEIHDKSGTKQSMAWADIAPVLRALYQQELDGFAHEPAQQSVSRLTGIPSYKVGDHVTLPGHDHEITGDISWIGDTEVTIKTGPYAWSHELMDRKRFEEMLRLDERNASLFTPERPAQETETPQQGGTADQEPAPGTATLYPGDKNGLPYDVVTEPLHIPEQEPAKDTKEPELASPMPPVPAAENFRILDDHLGEGGPKEKFWRNLKAIATLKQIEGEGRPATLEEQHILSQYVGWGGLPDAFDGAKTAWASEFEELRKILSPEEYEAAKASTLNAHYTSPTVIKAVYEAVGNMGFKSGNILEPSCGVGNFFGLLPEGMSASKLYGVELDSITGRIAGLLYPQAKIEVGGYEKAGFPKDFFDLAIGNVPYGQYQVNDPEYNRLGFSIHNYFFAKALDQVRPGGVVAFLTSRYTLDSKDMEVRRYLAQRANLLGAIRLPNNAFRANAGTDVVSDIIFLQKREAPAIGEPAWVRTSENRDGFAINRYFIDHPEMILGRQSAESTQYGKQDFTVEPIQGLLLADQLHDAVKYIHGEYRKATPPQLDPIDITEPITLPADPTVKNYSFTIVDGEAYYRENSIMVKAQLNASTKERVKGMAALRDCVRELIDLQLDEYTPDSAIKEKQAQLNALYDTFSAQYGLLNDRANRLAFSSDSSYYLLCALEVLDEDGKLERKADMFTKRTIRPHRNLSHVDTASEALAVSIGERAGVDLPYMTQLTGKTEEALIADLRGVIFKDPIAGSGPLDGWQTADEYLSGNVRKKLREAQRAARLDPAFSPNVEALELAQPKDLDASEIEVRLGATWIDKKYVQEFMYETLRTPYYLYRDIKVHYSPITAEWNITGKNRVSYSDVAAYTTYGTDRANAYRILEDSLNLRDVRIYDTVEDADGKEKRVLNAKETTLAAQKQQALRDAFRDWIWKDPDRRQALVQQYNEEMNSIRPREYDGSHIIFSGINPEIKLQPHQVNAIAHVLYGGNTLLAHEVGAGKTFEMIAAAMESKRLGLCQKSIFVVPNHLTEQTASEFLRLYPSANILVTTKRDFETQNRKKFCARISTGDYDAVIIGHSQFEKIPISMERQKRLLQEQIREITEGIHEVTSSGGERSTVKQLERTKKNLVARLEKLLANHRKDDVVTFEQLGVDRMFVDESDNYKNLFLYTKMRNVAGLSTTDAQKSSDMFAKCRYLDEITGGRGIVFATGTPISNSMTEMYTIQRYLQFNRLQEMGMNHFDCWASRFGETTTALELAPEGTGYRARTRFAKFFNLPELMNIFKEVADIKTADQLNLPTPEVEYHTIASKPTEIQKEMVKELSKRAEKVHGGIDPRIDNMLKITSDGRKLGLDQRIINPLLPDEEGTKVNRCVESVLKFWRDGDEKKLTQLVFCDISTPKATPSAKTASAKLDDPALHALEAAIPLEPEKPFTIYDDIREKLIAGGMPPEQVAFIHEANTDVQKKELFAKVRSGQVRVLIGSTQKMGAGTNVQDRLIALHDLDCPWRPRDLIQRKGRIERRGNRNPLVHVCRYVTEGTFDAYLWQTVENKQKFISQIMTSKSPVRSCEDVDEAALSFAEIKALCAGDPRIKERMELDVDVSRLKIMKADHQSKQFRMEDNVLKHFPEQISQNEGFIAGLKADMQTLEGHPHPTMTITKEKPADSKDLNAPNNAVPEPTLQAAEPPADKTVAVEVGQGFAGMVVKGMEFTDKEEASIALWDACKEAKGMEPVEIGSYRGFSMAVSVENFGSSVILTLKGQMSHRAELGKNIAGNMARIDHALSKMPERLAAVETQLGNLLQQLEAAKAEMGKPFPLETELKEKSARLAELDSLLNIGGEPPVQEQAITKSVRPSVLEGLKRPLLPRQKSEIAQPKKYTQER